MGRQKGQTLTDEQKKAMRIKREQNKTSDINGQFSDVLDKLQYYSFDQLNKIIKQATEFIEPKKEEERKKIEKQIEDLNEKLQKLQ